MPNHREIRRRARNIRRVNRPKPTAKDYFQIVLVVLIIAGIIGLAVSLALR